MLVFTRDDASVGLPVGEIVDIVESSVDPDLKPGRPGSLGSLIISGHAAELIDVDWYHRSANFGAPRSLYRHRRTSRHGTSGSPHRLRLPAPPSSRPVASASWSWTEVRLRDCSLAHSCFRRATR